MLITDILFNMQVKIKVVHSIPGRLRLHIPYAKQIPEEWRIDETYFNVFKCIHGVTDFEFNYITSNSLVKYDPKLTDEKHIIADLKAMTKLANRHRQKLSSYSTEEKEEAAKWFTQMIESEFKSTKRKET